ncbi:MAG: DUF5671 domain-containing protein [Chloroflexota bacterium]
MTTIRRTYTYLLALAGLLVTVAAGAGMASLIVSTLTIPGGTILSADDVRTRASLYLAELVVGLPVWLGHWLAAERGVVRRPEERQARQRRLFLAVIFAVTSVVALFALHDLLRFILTLPSGKATPATLDAAIRATTRMLAFGAAWLLYSRLERPPTNESTEGTIDPAHDLAVYILTGVALAFLVTGVTEAVLQISKDALGTGRSVLLADAPPLLWTVWGSIAAWMLAGGGVWALVWQYDLNRGGRRDLRVLFLYLVLIVAVPVTLGGGVDGLYELLRRALGYRSATGFSDFVPGVLAAILVGGASWTYHWRIVRQQARYVDEARTLPPSTGDQPPVESAPPDGPLPVDRGGVIAWPRRPGLALLTLLGLAAGATAFVSLLWLGLDFLLNSGSTLSGPDWWRDRLSASLATGAIGTAAWLGPWQRLQRATRVIAERAARERRLLLGFITVAGALLALGFLIALLWLAFRALLGVALGPHGVSTALKEFSGVLIALLVAAYHGVILRTDVAVTPAYRAMRRVRILLGVGSEPLVAALRQQRGLHVEVAGHLLDTANAEVLPPATISERLTAMGAASEDEQTLLVLTAEGGTILRYRL